MSQKDYFISYSIFIVGWHLVDIVRVLRESHHISLFCHRENNNWNLLNTIFHSLTDKIQVPELNQNEEDNSFGMHSHPPKNNCP